ncbi:MAG TPA: site-specific DNA-methyltransferase [Pseudolabrys sp.]|uniref:site-specific DNA-methyltransferase n=1 Tax=Pseudolabrys sp. TaxID=1960880 RepID=UPI002DDD52D8|nr:site-specific DNA-methyltransferase [Pseudolabrys sp.]HEV2630506.1 site-specific DNA-methyltransferase [Pseudolabrys sp.]
MAKGTKRKTGAEADVESYRHKEAKRKNIPTAENQKLVADEDKAIKKLRWPRNLDLDPQLVWRGKDFESDPLEVDAPPIYIQEKIQPGAIIKDLQKQSKERAKEDTEQFDFYGDFNGLPEGWKEDATQSYYHDEGNWQNRMILGDSLLVMASLAEREALRGKVQCIYIDPPYGIRFNSNWQPSTKSKDVRDGQLSAVSREPEVIRAFRDTWKDEIHSYVSYLRDRLIAARDLLAETGSIFVQIGEENTHLVRCLLDEVFGPGNLCTSIVIAKTVGQTADILPNVADYVIWYAKDRSRLKYRTLLRLKEFGGEGVSGYRLVQLPDGTERTMTAAERAGIVSLSSGSRAFGIGDLSSQRQGRPSGEGSAMAFTIKLHGREFRPSGTRGWSTTQTGIERLIKAARVSTTATGGIGYVRFFDDFPAFPLTNIWSDTVGQGQYGGEKIYVVQTALAVMERCILMTTDPGDLVLDPTCGSGTTAYVAEQWGRRWITIDTSRVALTLARARLMGAKYEYYLLKDSKDGAGKEGESTGKPPAKGPFTNNIRHGFVYERAPHVTLKSIANNAEIDVIWERWQRTLEPLREKLIKALKNSWEEWQIPSEPDESWPAAAKKTHAAWWDARRARQKEIDDSIARNADVEYLYDRPYKARGVVRVAGPFTVESLSPHRVLPMEEDPYLAEALAAKGEDVDGRDKPRHDAGGMVTTDFAQVVYENLKTSGVQNTKKDERLMLENLRPFASRSGMIQFEGRYQEKGASKRAAVCIGPEYDTVGYDLVRRAAREAVDMFDMLIVCGFAFAPEVDDTRLNFGNLTVLKARMNQDLRMADKLKATGAGNLFVVFGEPDIVIHKEKNDMLKVEIRGMDIFDPTTGEVRSSTGSNLMNDVAAWFIDSDYDEESFFVRQAYFVGDDPYDGLKRALKAEIDETAWAELNSTVSRPFLKPERGLICVKVINHFGDEVQKVFSV